jgi:hypothetical protein
MNHSPVAKSADSGRAMVTHRITQHAPTGNSGISEHEEKLRTLISDCGAIEGPNEQRNEAPKCTAKSVDIR